MNMPTPEPCPFCKGNVMVVDHAGLSHVYCPGCGYRSPESIADELLEAVVASFEDRESRLTAKCVLVHNKMHHAVNLSEAAVKMLLARAGAS